MMYSFAKLNKQHKQTWVNCQKWLNKVQFSHQKLFPRSEVHKFIKNKAVSVGSCKGYFIPSLLTTTAYLLASDQARVQTLTHNQPLNVFTICWIPWKRWMYLVLSHFLCRIAVVSANQDKGMILSPEVFDILNKLMKSHEDNTTGDIQLLCKLFSSERCSYHYSKENSRVIPPNTPFSILGSTQLLNVAKLIAKMDHGHGMVDRFPFAIPLAFRPTLTERESASIHLPTEVVEVRRWTMPSETEKFLQNQKCRSWSQELPLHYTSWTTSWQNYLPVFQPLLHQEKSRNPRWRVRRTLLTT